MFSSRSPPPQCRLHRTIVSQASEELPLKPKYLGKLPLTHTLSLTITAGQHSTHYAAFPSLRKQTEGDSTFKKHMYGSSEPSALRTYLYALDPAQLHKHIHHTHTHAFITTACCIHQLPPTCAPQPRSKICLVFFNGNARWAAPTPQAGTRKHPVVVHSIAIQVSANEEGPRHSSQRCAPRLGPWRGRLMQVQGSDHIAFSFAFLLDRADLSPGVSTPSFMQIPVRPSPADSQPLHLVQTRRAKLLREMSTIRT